MITTPISKRRNSITIKSSFFGFLLLMIINLLPDEWFHMVAVYNSGTPSYIRYKWLDYSFGIIEIFILAYGVYLIIKNRHKWIWTTVIILAVRELLYFLIADYSALAEGKLELYLCLFVGVALIEWQLQYGTDWSDKWKSFLIILMVNVFSIYLNVIMGRNGIAGRFNAVNLDVGTTGAICGIAFLAMLFTKRFKYRIVWSLISGIGLVLSGSRINLLITIILTVFSTILYIVNRKKTKNGLQIRLSTIASILGILILAVFFGANLINRFEASRIATVFNPNYGDDVLSGRPASLLAGLNILKKNPLGISAYFINLQYNSVMEGFDTFPHFGFLVQLILYGPLAIIPLYIIYKSLFRLFKQRNWEIFTAVLYLTLYNTIGGGPIVNPKIIYLFGCIFVIGWLAGHKCLTKGTIVERTIE